MPAPEPRSAPPLAGPFGFVGLAGLCPVCHAWTRGRWCAACRSQYSAPKARCPSCALPLQAPDPATRCGACVTDPPPFARVLCVADYGFPWDGLVARFKYQNAVELAPLLADAMAAAVRASGEPLPDALLPLPLTPARLAARGYDQALLLARHLQRRLRRPCWPQILHRRFDAPPQAASTRDERLRQVRGAFATHPAPDGAARCQGLHLALVDDVMTTGATASEAARLLLQGGARRVDLWVVARTPAPGQSASL